MTRYRTATQLNRREHSSTRPEACLAIVLVGLAAQGCQTGPWPDSGSIDATGSGGGGAAGQAVGGAPGTGGTGPLPGVDVTGRWAMFAFEDPVAVVLSEASSAIGGNGCCGGLDQGNVGWCCGAVTGHVAGPRVTFGFTVNVGLGPYTYATEAVLSANGQRMAGTFTLGGGNLPVAWVRIGPASRWLPDPDPVLAGVMSTRAAGYALALSNDPAAGTDFSAQQTYKLSVLDRFVSGDLGAYWDGEMNWRADEQTLVVGPVPETAPGLPVALWLRFDGATLASVEAAMASGTRYQFHATASQP